MGIRAKGPCRLVIGEYHDAWAVLGRLLQLGLSGAILFVLGESDPCRRAVVPEVGLSVRTRGVGILAVTSGRMS